MIKKMKHGQWIVYEEGKDYVVFDTEKEADAYMNPLPNWNATLEEFEDDIDYGD